MNKKPDPTIALIPARVPTRVLCTAIALAIVLALVLSGCSPAATPTASPTGAGPTPTTAANPSATAAPTNPADPTATPAESTPTPGASLTEADLAFVLDDRSFALLSDAAPLLAALGDGYEMSEAPSCVYEGFDRTFDYGYLQVYTIPQGDTDLLDGVYLTDNRYATARGLRVGDSREAVTAAYGDSASEYDLLYNLGGDPENLAEPSLTFVLEDDMVVAISWYSGSNAQGAGSGG